MKFNKKIKGFSVAEAMVTLLIVSIALSAIAPIFSKRNAATLNNVSKWQKTHNGTSITYIADGNVGIGVPQANDPTSKLEIREGGNNYHIGSENAFFTITDSSSNVVFELSKTGGITFRLPGGGTLALFKNSEGNDVFKINSDGSIDSNMRIKDESKTTTINADGSVSFGSGASIANDGSASFGVPAGAIMLFNGTSCPTNYTETSVPCSCTCSSTGGTCSCECSLGSGLKVCQRNAYSAPAAASEP